MSRFDAGQTEISQITTFDTVNRPVVEEPIMANGLAGLFSAAENILQNKADDKKNTVASNFRGGLLKIYNALNQKGMNPQRAKAEMELLYMNTNQNFPKFGDELSRVYTNVLNQTGMGQVLNESIREENRKAGMVDSLIQSGFIRYDASEGEKEAGLSEFMTHQNAQRAYTTQKQTLELMLSQGALSARGKELENAKLQSLAKASAFSSIPMWNRVIDNKVAEALRQVESGELDQAAAVAFFQQQFSDLLSEWTVGIGQDLTSEDRKLIQKLYEDRRDIAISRLDGSLEQSVYERQLKTWRDKAELSVIANVPEMAQLMLGSRLLGDQTMSIMMGQSSVDVMQGFARFLAGGVDENGDFIDGMVNPTEDPKSIQMLKKILSGDNLTNPEATNEAAHHLNRVLTGTTESERRIAKDPSKFNDTMDLFASQGFYEIMSKHPEKFTDKESAIEVIERHYSDEVLSLMATEFKNRNVYIPVKTESGETKRESIGTASELVQLSVMPSGIRFTTTSKDRRVIREAEKLNKEMAPILNRLVRAGAHLEGNQNYQQVATQLVERINAFQGNTSGPAGGDEDDLSLNQFNPEDRTRFRDAIASVESKGSGDYAAVGPEVKSGRYKGQRALGRYQIMPGNLPEWSMAALGRVVTVEEFMENPDIQDVIFDHRFGILLDNHGNPDDAASAWFTGQPLRIGANRSDGNINATEYVKRFRKALGD